MITSITKFKLSKPVTQEQAKATFLSTAPKYKDLLSNTLNRHQLFMLLA